MEHQRKLLAQVLPAHASAAQRGLIEISTSAFYHPILPLVCDTNMGAVSSPGLPLPQNRLSSSRGRARAASARTESPSGSFRNSSPGSLAFGGKRLGGGIQDLARAGREVDGHRRRSVRTQPGNFFRTRRPGPTFRRAGSQKLYTIHRFENDNTKMNLIFRDHTLSDLIGFVYSGMPPAGRRQPPHAQHQASRATGS